MSFDAKERWQRYYAQNREKILAHKRAYREAHPEKDKEYRKTHRAEALAQTRKWRAENHEKFLEQSRRSRQKQKSEYAARQHIARALKKGTIKKQPCAVCGKESAQAHHCDYNKPLEIVWLCPIHHAEWHANNEPIRKVK